MGDKNVVILSKIALAMSKFLCGDRMMSCFLPKRRHQKNVWVAVVGSQQESMTRQVRKEREKIIKREQKPSKVDTFEFLSH